MAKGTVERLKIKKTLKGIFFKYNKLKIIFKFIIFFKESIKSHLFEKTISV